METRLRHDWNLRRLQLVGEDISCLIHEVRTPLTAVLSAAELLKFPCSTERHRVLVDIIEKEAYRIDALFVGFFDAYHRDAGTWLADLKLGIVDVAELVAGVMARFCNLDDRYRLQTSIPADLPPLRADREKLTLVLRNLLANAVKYSPEGGAIRLSAEQKANNVILCVRDQGIGIARADLQRIFESSFRGRSSGGRETRGAGLGLAIVKRIVESHRGQVRVESERGRGSSFFVILPIDPAAQPPATEGADVQGGSKN